MEGLGLGEGALPRVAQAAYRLLGRRTFFTTGDKESRAWTFRAGAKAPECAGVIHSDLQRGFIRAEVVHWDELLALGSWAAARDVGKLRVEGKEYEVAGRRCPRDPLQRLRQGPSTRAGTRPGRRRGHAHRQPGRPFPPGRRCPGGGRLHLLRGHPPHPEALEPRRHHGAASRLPPPFQRSGHHTRRRRAGQGRGDHRPGDRRRHAAGQRPGRPPGAGGAGRGHPRRSRARPVGGAGRPGRVGLGDRALVLRGFPAPFRAPARAERLAAVAGEADTGRRHVRVAPPGPALPRRPGGGVRPGAAGGRVPGADQAPRGGLARPRRARPPSGPGRQTPGRVRAGRGLVAAPAAERSARSGRARQRAERSAQTPM